MSEEPAEISCEDLVRRVESGEELHVLDVRAPERLAAGRVDIVAESRFHNVKGSVVLAAADPGAIGLPRDALLAVVCGHGNDSRRVTAHLRGAGFRAASLHGGVAAWAHTVVPRTLASPPELDLLVQGDRRAKGCLAYLLASEGEAVIVDPPRRADLLLEIISRHGLRVVAVCDTHAHADYVSGASALARRFGAPYRLHPADATSPYDGARGRLSFEPIEDGATIAFGRARLTAIHTPGHTEGSVTFRLGDHLALTGDFVFVGSVGRPDLGGQLERWSGTLFDSLERARRDWPPTLRILPAHYASEEERTADGAIEGVFGELLRTNEPLAQRDRDAFLAWIRERAGNFPEAYRRIKRLNLGLELASDEELEELEAGRNQCALS